MRTFEPDAYKAIREAKDLLTGEPSTHSLGAETQTQVQQLVNDKIINKLSPRNRDNGSRILKELFPRVDGALGGYASQVTSQWYKDLRICHEDSFDRYFELGVPLEDIPQSYLDTFLESLKDLTSANELLASASKDGLISELFDRLEAYKEQIPAEHSYVFVRALFDASSTIPVSSPAFEISPEDQVARLIVWHLRSLSDHSLAFDSLKKAVQESPSLWICARVVASEEATLKGNTGRGPIFTEAQIAALKKICLTKLRAAAKSGTLLSDARLAYLLFVWKEWANPGEPQKWASQVARSPQDLVSILNALVSEVRHGDGKITRRIRLSDVEPFLDVDKVSKTLSQLDPAILKADATETLDLWNEAMRKRAAGIAESPFDS